jgi:hypothetical protein
MLAQIGWERIAEYAILMGFERCKLLKIKRIKETDYGI